MNKSTTLFIALLVLSGMAQAHNLNSPFYGVHRFFEGVEYFVASVSPLQEQAFIAVRNANCRTDEMEQTNVSDILESLATDFEDEATKSEGRLDVVNEPDQVRIRTLVQQAREKHLTVLESLLTKLPPQARARIEANIVRHKERIAMHKSKHKATPAQIHQQYNIVVETLAQEAGILCSDSDGGNVPHKLGVCTQQQPSGIYPDVCLNGDLVEFYCENDICKSDTIDCPFGCKNHACVGCSDSDNGRDYYSKGNTMGLHDCCTNAVGSVCLIGNYPSIYLSENFCEDNVVKSEVIECPAPDVCVAGRCIDVASKTSLHCHDSDRAGSMGAKEPGYNTYGVNYDVKGSCWDILGNSLVDNCPSAGYIDEISCTKLTDKDFDSSYQAFKSYGYTGVDFDGATDDSHWIYVCHSGGWVNYGKGTKCTGGCVNGVCS